tara:strand:+ start:253 stop:1167 length:915 start_codon:yes stop_codon:yes gene_type:complete
MPTARNNRLLAGLSLLAALLTFPLIGFGAIVRLKGGGLGCPDWPLCYGKVTPLGHLLSPPGAELQQGLEMGHRYVASLLGLICIAMVWKAVRSPFFRWAMLILGLVIFQGLLGRYTVTLKLAGWTVAAHLLFGNICFVMIVSFALRTRRLTKPGPWIAPQTKVLLPAFFLTLLTLVLGGYTSGSGASYHCPGWPLCPNHFPGMEIEPSLKMIHFSHRLAAAFATIATGWGLFRLWQNQALNRNLILLLASLFLMEVVIGAANALTFVPVPLSGLHTLVAALIIGLFAAILTPKSLDCSNGSGAS